MPVPSHLVDGFCDDRFVAVRDVFRSQFDSDRELPEVGASVAATLDGELVVDLWGGHLDEAATEPWRRDTITNVWSSTKTMAALCVLMLADRRLLTLDTPVAAYWPEFAAAGKERVTVRHLLGHTAGLPGWSTPLHTDDLFDTPRLVGLLAAEAPWWEPGRVSGYHAVTQGFLLGELVVRVAGRPLGRFFAEEVAGPMEADFHIGVPAGVDDRVAPMISASAVLGADTEPRSLAARAVRNPPLSADIANEVRWRRAELPAINGHGNARSIARVHAAIACGGSAAGVRLMSEAGCQEIFTETARGIDLVLGLPVWFGTGFGLIGAESPLCDSRRACYWGGWGGSLTAIDLERRMSVAYVMNRMAPAGVIDDRGSALVISAFASAPPAGGPGR